MPTATGTLSTLGGAVINTGVSLAQVIFTTYWPYFLVFGVIVGLVIWIRRVVSMGHR